MDYKVALLADLEKGYSKSDLEKLIGLPQNNLSGILKGDRNLSKKSKLKIEKWMASEKPDPLNVFFKPKENGVINKLKESAHVFTYNQKELEKEMNEFVGVKRKAEIDEKAINERIAVLRKEIAKPPSTLNIPLRAYKNIRQNEIAELESKLTNQ